MPHPVTTIVALIDQRLIRTGTSTGGTARVLYRHSGAPDADAYLMCLI